MLEIMIVLKCKSIRYYVIPTKVGIQFFAVLWIPAYAGMTVELLGYPAASCRVLHSN